MLLHVSPVTPEDLQEFLMIWLFETASPQGMPGVQKPGADVEFFCENGLFNRANHSTTASSNTGNTM